MERTLNEYPNLLIYSDGRVYSKLKKRFVGCKQKNGYVLISVTSTKKMYVHRLVALAFPEICGEYEDDLEVDHLNTIRDDNRAENLRWVTRSQNRNNPISYERFRSKMKGKTPWNKGIPLTEECKEKKSKALKGRHWRLENGIRVWS